MSLLLRSAAAILTIIAIVGAVSVVSPRTIDTPPHEPAPVYSDDLSFLGPLPPVPGYPDTPPTVALEKTKDIPPLEEPKKTSPPIATPAPKTPSPAPQASAPESPGTTLSVAEINTKTRAALVNIYCSTKAGGAVQPFTGSGIVIDPRGIVLTNAHLGQYLLLEDYPVKDSITCTLRTGSPARETYRAELMYLPERWINEHAKDIVESNPVGTGEHDYALLRITSTVSGGALPAAFSFVPYATGDGMTEGAQVLVAGYPAELVGTIATLRDLYITSSVSTIKKIYTFTTNTPDLISVGSTVVAQKGASGGAVVDTKGNLIGIVVTATDGASTADRDLRAATLAHVSRSVAQHTGKSLHEFLSGSPASIAATFHASEAPILRNKLIEVIEKSYAAAP